MAASAPQGFFLARAPQTPFALFVRAWCAKRLRCQKIAIKDALMWHALVAIARMAASANSTTAKGAKPWPASNQVDRFLLDLVTDINCLKRRSAEHDERHD